MTNALVVDLGGTHLRSGLVDAAGALAGIETQCILSVASGASCDETWDRIRRALWEREARARQFLSPTAPIVIAFPGPVATGRTILGAPTLCGGCAVPDLAGELENATGRRVYLLNDVAAAAWRFSALSLSNRFMVVTVSSGIGSKIFDRQHSRCVLDDPGYAGEIGHFVVDDAPDAPLCDCGERGHLGAIASGRGIERAARREAKESAESFRASYLGLRHTSPDRLTNEEHLVPAALNDDPWATALIRDCTRPLSRTLLSVVMAAGIERVFLIGGFAQALGERYRDMVRSQVTAMSRYPFREAVPVNLIEIAAPGEYACLEGCAVFARSSFGATLGAVARHSDRVALAQPCRSQGDTDQMDARRTATGDWMIVTVLGGSAHSTPFLADALARAVSRPLTLRLAGRQPERLHAVARACQMMSAGSLVSVETYQSDRWLDAISGSGAAVIQLRVGGYSGRAFDEQFPLESGVPGDEGLGPGGLSAAYRAWPLVARWLRELRVNAPACHILLLTSPGGLLVRLARAVFPGLSVVHPCELPLTTLRHLCGPYHAQWPEVTFDYAGVNHLGWFYNVDCLGTDPVAAYADSRVSEVFPSAKLVGRLGAFPSKYLRLHYALSETVREQVSQARSRAELLKQIARRSLAAFASGNRATVCEALVGVPHLGMLMPSYPCCGPGWATTYRFPSSSRTATVTPSQPNFTFGPETGSFNASVHEIQSLTLSEPLLMPS